ncbi:hypothetical protein GV791_10680 [Nocardia cyriacigeorgica]|uniref:Uncharacterized protein n=1 Tax=Nocardia cyriacigeorgica TaxID=135487 RepID=A0A6P1CKP4_9NOCA|nr:hypothetical protein [Nocardia cyriacigeorgica]MBF6083815.1 hypothetical protein [Nocardia cyriacigeorgica]NEW33018.1 hypothetical protein [Nocardia cyriacigeorgica]
MADSEQDVTLWRHLAGEAESGSLYLDESVAKDCLAVIDSRIDLFKELRRDLTQIERVTGLGDFACTKELAKMLGLKAVGGEGDLDSALSTHLEVLVLMRDTISKSVKDLTDQDTSTSQAFNGTQVN